jgi:site-specific recombinase XerD
MKYENIAQVKKYLERLAIDSSPKTIASYSISIDKFFDYLKIELFEDVKKIAPSQCSDYQVFLSKSGLEHSSINAYIRPLRAMFNWMITQSVLKKNPWKNIKNLKTPKEIPDYLTNEEIRKMLDAANKLNEKSIFACAVLLGLRREALASIKLENIYDKYIHIESQSSKGDKSQNIPLRQDLKELIGNYIDLRNKHNYNSPYLFVSKMGDKYSGEAIRQIFIRLATKAGLPPERVECIHPHLARHSYAVRLRRSCKDMRIVQRGMNHSSMTTTMIYDHVYDEELAEAMNKQESIL